MMEEKSLPQDESANGQDEELPRLPQDESANVQDEGPVPVTRDGRIKLSTERGGLKRMPAFFSNEYLDWETIKSDSPFEVLYLDYRSYDRITRAIIDGNFSIIKKFWADIAMRAMSSPPVTKKYGGMDSIRRYPQILQKAYTELTSDVNAPKKCFDQIIRNKQESLTALIESNLIQVEYTPEIRKNVTEKGIEIGLTEKEVSSLLIRLLEEKSFVPEQGTSDDHLSVKWYSPEKMEEKLKDKIDGLKKQLDSTIQGILSDHVFEPSELGPLKEKGKELGYPEEQLLFDFEKKLLEDGFSPDPDADIKKTDTINKRLSVIWRTDEKHLDFSVSKFRVFLGGMLHNGMYNPVDYVKIIKAATGNLRQNPKKLDSTLIDYLKKNGFKPVGKCEAGKECDIKWKRRGRFSIPHYMKLIVIAVVLVAVTISGYLFFHKKEDGTVMPPQGSEKVTLTDNKSDSARILALDALRNGTDLSVTISKIPKLEKVLAAAHELGKISPRYQEQITSAERMISAARNDRDKKLLAYLGKVVELNRYTPEQTSNALDVIRGGDLTSREKKVVELLTEDMNFIRKQKKADPKIMLSNFNDSFRDFVE